MRDVRGYRVHFLPPDQTEWLFQVYGKLGFGPEEDRLFLQAAISWTTAMAQPVFDTLGAWRGAAPGEGTGFVVPEEILTGEATDLYSWLESEFTPWDRTRDPGLLAALTPPDLGAHEEAALSPVDAGSVPPVGPWSPPALTRRPVTEVAAPERQLARDRSGRGPGAGHPTHAGRPGAHVVAVQARIRGDRPGVSR